MSSSHQSSSANKIIYQEFGSSNQLNIPENDGAELLPQQQKLKIQASKSGRKGKTVTIISGFQCSAATLTELLKQLKSKCGTGGTIKENTLELQGDRRQQLLKILGDLGYQV